VNDYLEPRLAELNKQRVSDRMPWLLVQPSGAFPLVGPVFNPGNGPCWTCLFDRMIRNREIKGFLERGSARPVAVSPLSRKPLGQGAIQFAALETAKAIASGFRTELNNHIISHDLLGSNVVKHFVAARPQCPTCGSKKLRDPRRAPTPIELGAGAKLIMTSGGYRTVSSRATVARFRKHVSPLTGVVTKLERIEADLPMNTNYFAGHNFSAPALTVDALREGLTGGSFGKGSTAEQAEASALMEAIERYSGIFQGDEIRIKRRFTDFPSDEAIHPNDVLMFSDAQFRAPEDEPDDSHPVPPAFDTSAKLDWSPVWSLRDQRFKYLPTSLLYFFYGGPDAFHADSNGCAAGNTREEAIVQGFLELVERDAYAIWWYNRSQRAEVDLSQFNDSYVRDLQSQLADTGRKLWVLDITSDLGVPTYVAILHWMQNGHENIEFGSGAHFDRRIALLRTLTELNQFLSIGLMGGGTGEKPSLDGITPLHLQEYPFLIPGGNPVGETDCTAKFGPLETTRQQVDACVDIARRAGLDFLVLDQTRPDVEVPVVRVIVPGLRHFYRRFGPGRLYDVPVKLGLRDQPIPESELTPYLPHS
jgi:ribosomal protein S12 methylthiotransferase accessory factor